jgi:hypothetical protein
VGHECVRSEIAIVFGGEESLDDRLTLNLTSVVFDSNPQNTVGRLSQPRTAVPIRRFAGQFQRILFGRSWLFADDMPNTADAIASLVAFLLVARIE